MKIASWNVNSVKVRLPHLLAFLEDAKPDILCLQETKCLADEFPRLEIAALGYRVETLGQRAYNGVALVSREPARDIVFGLPGLADEQARYVGASFSSSGGTAGDCREGPGASAYIPNASPTAMRSGITRPEGGTATRGCGSTICGCRRMPRTGSPRARSTRPRAARIAPPITPRSGASSRCSAWPLLQRGADVLGELDPV